MDDSVKAYMAKIGAKGGAAGKGTEKRKRLNKRAAKIRWAKHRKPKLSQTEGWVNVIRNLNISPNKSPMKPLA